MLEIGLMFKVQCSRLGVIGLRFEVQGWRFEVRDLGCCKVPDVKK
jgi:hypothetical protein